MLPCAPFGVEEREGSVVDKLVTVIGSVGTKFNFGGEAIRAQIQVFAFHASDGQPGMQKNVLKLLYNLKQPQKNVYK